MTKASISKRGMQKKIAIATYKFIFVIGILAPFECLAGPASGSDTPVQLMQKAQTSEQAGDLVAAEASYKELIALNSNLQEYALFYFGDLLLKQKRDSEAQSYFQKVLQLSPNLKLQTECQFRLAQMALEQKAFSKARKLLAPLEKKLRREEMYPQVLIRLSRAERGAGRFSNFCRWMRKLYSRYPELPELKSWGLQLQSNTLDGKPTQCSPSSEDQRTRIRNLQWAAMGDEAKKEIDEFRQLKQSDKLETDKLYVQYLLHEGEVSKALDVLLPYYAEHKSHLGFMMTFASAAARAGETQASVGSYYKAYKIGGRGKIGRQALFQSAFLSYQVQDYDGAARKFQEFMKVFPSSGLARDAKWHLAWIRYLKGDFDGAYKSMGDLRHRTVGSRRRGRKRKVVTDDRVTYWMAMSLLRQNKTEEAKPLFESLGRDHLLGYYSIAAGFRLKKIEALLPKHPKRTMLESVHHMARFNVEAILPSDGFATISNDDIDSESTSSEESESEESLVMSPLHNAKPEESVNDEAASEQDSDDDGSVENAEAEVIETKTPFANLLLVKRFERAQDLATLGMIDWAKWDLYDIERKTSNPEYLKTLMVAYEKIENFQRSSYIGQTSFGSQRSHLGLDVSSRPIWEHTYPKAYASLVQKFSKQFDIPFELVWGIMRAESQYKKDVISPVGALGLMQVMPNTGQKIAGMIGDTQFETKKLLEPETAVKIGSRYLARLMKKFENSVPLTAAGYNAGPHRVKSWLVSFGDLEIDEFIEHIPFLETRNYVKRVVSNFYIYNQLYGLKKEGLSSLAEMNRVRITEPVLSKETWEDM
jgi:soluble lytic murein transglycosylase